MEHSGFPVRSVADVKLLVLAIFQEKDARVYCGDGAKPFGGERDFGTVHGDRDVLG
jgi:hypothetical protein